MLHVVTSYFRVRRIPGSVLLSSDPNLSAGVLREAEYAECIARNAASHHVANVHLVAQDAESLAALHRDILGRGTSRVGRTTTTATPPAALEVFRGNKKKIVPTLSDCHPLQPSYAHLFGYCDRMLAGQLCMVCNADIYVPADSGMEHVPRLFAAAQQRSKRLALALTRYESDGSPSPTSAVESSPQLSGGMWDAPLINDYRGSHDAFIFRSPLGKTFCDGVRHPQNCYKAENIVIHELRQRARCEVLNPSRSVRVVHLHTADVRQWLPPADETRYGRAPPITTAEALEEMEKS
jgi:hypothetical protein